MTIFLLIKTTGGYHEPAESEVVAEIDDRIEAEDRARALNRTSRSGSYHVEEFVEDPPPVDQTECRRCGEIDECTGPGLCESCMNQMRRSNPGARL